MEVPPRQDDERLSHVLKALGNPVRLQIVRFVHGHPGCIGNQILLHLPAQVARAQSTLSEHIKVLRDAGVLDAECDGSAVCYALNRDCLVWLHKQLIDL